MRFANVRLTSGRTQPARCPVATAWIPHGTAQPWRAGGRHSPGVAASRSWPCRLACAACAATTLASAQTGLPDPSPELQRQDRQRQELRQRSEPLPWAPVGAVVRTPEHQRLPAEEPCLRIELIEVEGALATAALRQALDGVDGDDPPAGRCLGGQGITLLLQRLQQALVARGYITSQAHAPAQDLRSGKLTLQVLEGRVGRIRARDDAPVPRLARALRAGDVLRLRDVEQTSENLQRLPSLSPRIQIEPGEEAGTSDLVLDLAAGRPLRLGLGVDDTGNRSTGRVQGHLTLSWDNPLGLADMAYLTQGRELGDEDHRPRGTRNRIVHYSLPWGYALLSVTSSGNRYRQTVFGPYDSYLYHGQSGQHELAAQQVLHRDGRSKTTVGLEAFLRESRNYIDDLEVRVQRRRTAGWKASLQHLRHAGVGTFSAQLAWRRGTGAFGALPAPEEVTGQGTSRMRLLMGQAQAVLPFGGESAALQYSAQWQWQHAWTRLTPQDRFCIGGRSTVRGFDGQQTLCGDLGHLLRQEVSAPLPWSHPLTAPLRSFVALDAGRARTPGVGGDLRMAGAAGGLRGQHALGQGRAIAWEVFGGRPLTSPAGFAPARHVVGFSLRAEF